MGEGAAWLRPGLECPFNAGTQVIIYRGEIQMVSFSNDVDILKYEPMLFGSLHLPWQVLVSGNDGVLSGTTFTCSGADFESAGVIAGGVIYLLSDNGDIDGGYEIVSVDSPSQLTVSVVRADSDEPAVAVGNAEQISYRISTFRPQAAEAGFMLTEYFGIAPGNPASDYDGDDIVNPDVLKGAGVCAVISSVYAMLGSKGDGEGYWKKSLYYKKLLEKAKQRCRLSIDSDGDGSCDFTRVGASVRLVRD